jgi:hypothetical protein
MSFQNQAKEMSDDDLLEALKKPRKAYDYDVANQNEAIARLWEKLNTLESGSSQEETKKRGRKPKEQEND